MNEANKEADITSYALGQAAMTWKKAFRRLTPGYIMDLFDADSGQLAEDTIRTAMSKIPEIESRKILESEGTVEALLSERYASNYSVAQTIEDITKYANIERYLPVRYYLSKSIFTMAFIDVENTIDVNGEKMAVGFVVTNSDIGRSSLKVIFFLYKFACKNGIYRIGKGGILYRQEHKGERISDISIQKFRDSFANVDLLRETAVNEIMACQGKRLSEAEKQAILKTAKNNSCDIGEKEQAEIIDLASNRYGMTRWGMINGITEVAQKHTLDTRVAYETWAGRLLTA